MGLRIESKNVFSAPKYESKFQSIPGRDGDLILPNGRFPNVQITYSVFLPAKTKEQLAEKIAAVKAWLFYEPDRYHELRDSYDTTGFRKAVINTQLDIEDQLNKIGVFTVSFSCMPFRYLDEGQEAITITSSPYTITNPTVFQSKPYIRVNGNGEGRISINSTSQHPHWDLTNIDGYIEFDSEQMNFYKGSEPKNDCVEGSGFPVLDPGTNSIIFAGDITSVSVIKINATIVMRKTETIIMTNRFPIYFHICCPSFCKDLPIFQATSLWNWENHFRKSQREVVHPEYMPSGKRIPVCFIKQLGGKGWRPFQCSKRLGVPDR